MCVLPSGKNKAAPFRANKSTAALPAIRQAGQRILNQFYTPMAIYSFNAKVISRSAGQSSVATAAYNARDKLTDERTGETKYYYGVEGLLHSGIYLPEGAPEWAKDREQLWNHAEAAERRGDATIARNYIIALPHELTDEQRRYAIQDFVKENFTRKGYAADLNIHAPDKDGDNRNYHAHILVTDRRLEPEGFAANKLERQGTKSERAEKLEAERESWERIGNRHLERWGHEPTLDRRTLEAQGIEREATIHMGADVCAMEKKGIETDRGNEARQIEARNSELENLKNEAEKISQEIINELQNKQRENSGLIDPTLYDKGGMVSQQMDAIRDHNQRQKLLDEKEVERRAEWLDENLPHFQKGRALKAETERQQEAAKQQGQHPQQDTIKDEQEQFNEGHAINQSQNNDHRQREEEQRESDKKAADYAERYGKILTGGKELTEKQRERLERAADKAAQRERGGYDEPEQEQTERVRERTRER